MGRCSVSKLGGEAKVYQKKDFTYIAETGVLRFPKGVIFGDFSVLMFVQRSGDYSDGYRFHPAYKSGDMLVFYDRFGGGQRKEIVSTASSVTAIHQNTEMLLVFGVVIR